MLWLSTEDAEGRIIGCMRLGRSWSIAVGLTLGAAALLVPHLSGFGVQTDEELSSRIERENNPVKKAKFEIRLGRRKLTHALDACEKDDHPRCQESLGSFLTLMKSSWDRPSKNIGTRASLPPR